MEIIACWWMKIYLLALFGGHRATNFPRHSHTLLLHNCLALLSWHLFISQLLATALLAPGVSGLHVTDNWVFSPIFFKRTGTDLLALFSDSYDLSFDHDKVNIFSKLKNHVFTLASPGFLCFHFHFLVFTFICVPTFTFLLPPLFSFVLGIDLASACSYVLQNHLFTLSSLDNLALLTGHFLAHLKICCCS